MSSVSQQIGDHIPGVALQARLVRQSVLFADLLETKKPAPFRKKICELSVVDEWGERGSNPHVVTNDRF